MAVYAELFDGTRLEFPDGTDPSVISATAKRITLSRTAAPPADPSGAVPDELGRYDAAKQSNLIAQQNQEPTPETENFSVARQVADVPLQVTKGAVSGVRMIADAFGAGSDTSKTLRGTENYLADLMSAQSKQDSKQVARIMKEAEDKGALDQVKAAVQAMSVAPIDFIANAFGTAGPAILAGLGATVLGPVAGIAAGVSVGSTMGAGVVKGSIYDAVKEELSKTGMPSDQAEARALLAQEYGGKNLDMILAGAAIGSIGATTGAEPAIARQIAKGILTKSAVKKELSKAAEEGLKKAAERGVAKQAAITGSTEFATEFGQAGQEQLAQNIAAQREGVDVPTMRGVVGQATLEGLAGLGLGSIAGGREALSAKNKIEQRKPPKAPPPDVIPPEDQTTTSVAPPANVPPSESQDTQQMIDEFNRINNPPVDQVTPPIDQTVPPVDQVVPPVDTTIPAVDTTVEPVGNIWENIQNRDRSTPASVAQMAKIANEPDYSRVSMSRDYGTGAPIVAGNRLEPAQLGRIDTVTGSDGKKSEIQYAVVDSRDVIASHNADGTKNPDYVNPRVKAFRAVTNGRVAGLQAAYNQGTATDYKNALLSDDLHGVDKKVIEGMENPMLVRIMPMSEINKNTGDISNTGAGLSFNIVEQAKNDTNRLDLSTVQFSDSGDVSQQTIKDFIKAMPTTEQGNLMDKQGNPTKQAVERVDAAIFQQAYGNDKLTELAFQSQDEEARNIVRALNMAASKAIQLGNAGDYDVRPLVNEAVELAINARRNNISLQDAAKQVDMTANPLSNEIIKMFADNPRSAKAIGENLSNLFDNAYKEGSKEGSDMFGAVPKRPVDQLIKESFAKKTEPDLFAEPIKEPTTKPVEQPVDQPIQAVSPEPKEFKIKKSMEEIAAEISKMTKGSQVSQWLIDNAPNSAARAIAEKINSNINAIEKSGVPVQIEVLSGNKRSTYYGYASYVAKKGAISHFAVKYNGLNSQGKAETFPPANKPTGTRYSTIMHELLHVLSMVQLDTLIKRNFKGPEKLIQNELRAIYRAVEQKVAEERKLPVEKRHPVINRSSLWLKNVDELWVRSLTESDLQNFLSTIDMGKKTALTKIMEIFRKVVGLNPQYQSALDKIMTVSDKIFAQTPQDIARLAKFRGYTFITMKEEPWYDREMPDRFGREMALGDFYKKMQESYDEFSSPQEAYEAAYEDATSDEKAILRQLQKENLLGFDYPHQAIQAIIEEPENFELTPALKAAISRAGNKAAGITPSRKEKVLEEKPTLKTNTPQFKKWFGNSKITNEDGSPKVLYHITPSDFDEFIPGGFPDERGYLSSGNAIWLSPNKERQPAAHNISGGNYGDYREGVNVMPLYVKMENPLVLDDKQSAAWAKEVFAKGSNEFPLLMNKDWVKEIKDAGYDGVIWTSPYGRADGTTDHEYIVFDPSQVKSAIGNTGEYNPEDARIQYEEPIAEEGQEKPTKEARNYLGKPVKPTWEFPEDTFIHVPGVTDVSVNDLIYKFQDKQIDTKRAQEAISKAAGVITDEINVYQKEQLFHGKVATAIREYLLNELLPAIKKLKEFNLKPQEMQDYLLARHAEERNNKMNELNKLDPRTGEERTTPWELQDRASGMSTADARALLKGLDPAKKEKLEIVAKMFDDMVTGTQKILVDSGADSQDTIDSWNDTYKHYVPLFRIEEDFINGGMGATALSKGFNVSGGFSKRAMGSEKEVQDIIANLIKQRERALIRAEKLTVTKALYGLFLMNPNPDVALPVNPDAIKSKDALIKELEGLGYDNAEEIANNLMEEPKSRYISKGKRVIDKNTGLPTTETPESVKLKVDNLARFGDNVLTLRIDGKNRYMFFNQKNPDAKRMATSLRSLDVESLGTLTSLVSKATRWFASVNTQYNPIFAAVNLIRDVGGAQFNLTTTPLAGKQAQVTAGIFPAMKGIFKVLRAERGGEVGGDSDMEKAFRDFRKEGGQTGYRDSLARKESEKSIVDEQLAKITAGGNAKKAFKAVFGALSDFNDTLENAIRLSSYLAASKPKDKGGLGLSKQQAAIIAKNLTVNFDKKGQLSANINALYAFFNASIQGTARLAQTLKGPKGKAIIGGGVLLGSMQAILLAAAGFKDDEPPEFVKERNFIIPTPGGGYLSIPYPLGLHILPGVGRITTEFMLTGGKNPTKKVGNLIGVFADGLSPVGSAGPLQTIAPTVLDPLAALSENKDAFGRPIYKKDQATNPTPGYMRSRESSNEISKQISYFLNMASGGGKYSKGLVSPTADEIDYVVGQVTGGVGRELMKTGQTLKALGTGEDLPTYRVPLAGRFYGETQSNAAESQRFYSNVVKMADHENEIKGRMKNKEPVAPYLKEHPEARLWQMANTTENQINALNKQKKEFIEKDLPKERIKRIENQKATIMKRFNDHLAKIEK